MLLVPKHIVRKNYLFGIGQYFERIILERKQAEYNWKDDKGKPIAKREITKNLRTDNEHWQYKYTIKYTQEHTDALEGSVNNYVSQVENGSLLLRIKI